MKRYIVEKVRLVTHQSVVYAADEKETLAKYRRGEIENEPKPFYEAPAGSRRNAIHVYEGSEQ